MRIYEVMTLEGAFSEAKPDRIEVLYLRHADGVLRFAFLLTGSREHAEDVVQESFLRVLGKFGSLRHEDSFGAYLRRTVVNVVRDEARKGSSSRRHAHLIARESTFDPILEIAGRATILGALQSLPVRQRAAVVLRYYDDLSEAQSAEVLRCSKPAVRSLVARATEALRASLGGFHDES